MSYSVPGPGHDNFWVRRREQPPAERLAPVPKPRRDDDFVTPQKPRDTKSIGRGEPPFDHLMWANEERLAALKTENEQLARSALREVVVDLDMLLDSATAHVWSSRNTRNRKQIKKIVKRDLAASTAAALPLGEIADLLDVPREQVEMVLRSLRVEGAVDRGTQDAALRQIRFLRAQLQLVEATEDHSLLDKLVAFIVKIAQALAIAVTATVTGTLAIGGRLVEDLVVNAAVVALVTLALQSATTAIRDRRNERNPYAATREALSNLNAELANFVSIPGAGSAYALEKPVGQIRLLVKTYNAQQALIEIQWADKAVCWNVLSELAVHLSQSDINADRLAQLLRKLRTVQDQVPKG